MAALLSSLVFIKLRLSSLDKELEEILALELFRALIYLEQKITKGPFKAITMAY